MADTAAPPPTTRYGNRPTMKDVAARAGVGLKTVSRVVNGEPGVTPDTERRVQEAIDARSASAATTAPGSCARAAPPASAWSWRISPTRSTAR